MGLGDLYSLVTPRNWVQSSCINAALQIFGSLSDAVHFADISIMFDWVDKVEKLYNIKFKSMDGTEKGMFKPCILNMLIFAQTLLTAVAFLRYQQ